MNASETFNYASNNSGLNYIVNVSHQEYPYHECYHAHPDIATVLIVAVDLLLAVAAIIGNLLVIIAVLKFERLKTVTNIFVVSLAAADLLVGLNVPYYVIFYFNTVLACYKIGCLLRYWSEIFSTGCSMLCLVGVAVDRYVAILHPLSYPRLVRRNHAKVFVAVVWIYNFFVSTVPILGIGETFKPEQECDLYYSHSSVYVLLAVSSHVLGCLLIITILYCIIFREAWKQRRNVAALELNRRVRQETKTARTMSLVLGLCLLGFVPYFLIITTRYFKGLPQRKISYIKRFIVALYFGKSAFNPLVYGWKNTDFREAFRKILHPPKPSISHIL